ncbi:glycosyltransferase [Lysobacter sp. A378]
MRILLIAHEFPPIPSAQSLRWAYLVRELALQGHQVHVLAPDHPGYGPSHGYPELPSTVAVHRTFPGPFAWLLKFRPTRSPATTTAVCPDTPATNSVRPPGDGQSSPVVRLNWKGRLFGTITGLYGFGMFPDLRAEWNPWARRALGPLLEKIRPDVVIASHEPASTLSLGFMAQQHGYRLAIDLGDPVCTGYTPRRWRQRSLRLERRVCDEADLVTVTSAATRDLLISRHGAKYSRIHVMEQGFDDSVKRTEGGSLAAPMDAGRLEMLYTGSFYSFRRSTELVAAVVGTAGVRLTVASSAVPDALVHAADRHPEAIRLLGFLPHCEVLKMQRRADLLVNLGNDDPTQIPGKIYEYLGSGQPILHIGDDLEDESAMLLQRTGAGWVCNDDRGAIAGILVERLQEHLTEVAPLQRHRNEDAIGRYAWKAHAHKLAQELLRSER